MLKYVKTTKTPSWSDKNLLHSKNHFDVAFDSGRLFFHPSSCRNDTILLTSSCLLCRILFAFSQIFSLVYLSTWKMTKIILAKSIDASRRHVIVPVFARAGWLDAKIQNFSSNLFAPKIYFSYFCVCMCVFELKIGGKLTLLSTMEHSTPSVGHRGHLFVGTALYRKTMWENEGNNNRNKRPTI